MNRLIRAIAAERQRMLVLLALVLLALGLRLLTALLRPVWVDEAASAIFTAGNSSWSTPLNALVSLESFTRSLQLQPDASLLGALEHLHQEDNHPPLHFGLAFGLARLGQPAGSLLHPLSARLPAVLMGSLAVPLLMGAVQAATHQRRAARIAAALAAVSPLAVALGGEARHYALANTLVCAALWALAAGWQRQRQGMAVPWSLRGGWLLINLLGVLTHHLFVLCIAAQLLCLAVLSLQGGRLRPPPWPLIAAPLASLLLAALLLGSRGTGAAIDQTSWLQLDPRQPAQVLLIPLQILVTALSGLLAPGTSLSAPWQWPALVLAGLATVIGLVCLGAIARRAGPPPPLLLSYCLSSMAVVLLASVLGGKDLSRALRYGFLYLPGVLALVACAAAGGNAQRPNRLPALLLSCSLICSLGVATGVALPASYNPALFVERVNRDSTLPVVLAFNERPVPSGQPLIGYEGLSLAWHLSQESAPTLERQGHAPQLLLLVSDGQQPPAGLQALAQRPGPFDLWIVNAHGTTPLTLQQSNCTHLTYASAGGHLHHHYRCKARTSNGTGEQQSR